MDKAFKYRIYPNKKQQEVLSRIFGSVRFVYNFFLSMRNAEYAIGFNTVGYSECSRQLTLLKQEKDYAWLNDSDATALQSALRHLDDGFQAFFRRNAKHPRFHSKKSHYDSYTSKNNNNSIRVEGKHIRLPKVGFVRMKESRPVTGRIISATVSRVPSGKYYISVLCDAPDPEPLPVSDEAIGIDMGVSALATLSDGTIIENPKYLERSMRRLRHEQKSLSRKTRGSRNSERQRLRVARLQEHIASQRRDCLNKLSTYAIRRYGIIGVESLDVKSMLSGKAGLTNRQAAAIHRHMAQTGMSMFLAMLRYKSEWYGRKYVQADKYFASSQTCHVCGAVNPDIKDLRIRSWICPVCGTSHDRDINAAINLKNHALSM